jgi:hypothetical protein
LQEYCAKQVEFDDLKLKPYGDGGETDKMMKCANMNIPKTAEQFYYRSAFEYYYEGFENVVPYFWMPKYVDAKDASARTLAAYTN